MEIKITFDEETLSTLHKLADSITRFTEAKPSEILPLEGDVDIVEKPKVEKPKVEKPKVEKPKVEKPKVEKPKVEKPKVEKPKVEKPKAEEPKAEKPKAEKPKVEEPKVEEPKAEEPKVVPTVTIKDIQRLGAAIIQADPSRREDVVTVLTTVGQSKKVSDIDPSLLDTVYQALKDIE